VVYASIYCAILEELVVRWVINLQSIEAVVVIHKPPNSASSETDPCPKESPFVIFSVGSLTTKSIPKMS
jgi:hypothetical protein